MNGISLRRVRRHPSVRPVAALLCWTLLLMSVPLPWATSPAESQQLARKPVAVLDFDNASGYGGPFLGRAAAAALMLALETQGYDVRSREVVALTLAALNLQPPYTSLDLQKLGRSEDVDVLEVMTGEVVQVKTMPASVSVTIAVAVTDVESATVVNGAVIREDYAPTGYQGDVESLVERALEKAAERAVREITARQTPRGRVMTVDRTGRVTISLGQRDGIKPGMRMAVLRPKYDPTTGSFALAQVATVRVSETTQDDAQGQVVGEAVGGIETGDIVKPIFSLREQKPSVDERRQKGKSAVSQLVKLALPVAFIFGLLSLNRSGKAGKPPTVKNAVLVQTRSGDAPYIRIRWNRSSAPSVQESGGWSIYRSQVPNFSAGPDTLIDVLSDRRAESYDDWPLFFTREDVEINVTWLSTDDEEEGSYTATFNHYAPVAGQTYFYKVRRIARPASRPPSVGGAGGTRQQEPVEPSEEDDDRLLSDPSRPIGPVTYVGVTSLSKPANGSQDQRVSSITFEWNAVAGGDEYVVELLADPQGRVRLWRSPVVRAPSVVGTVPLSQSYDRTQPGFFALQPETTYFWRVGARNSDPDQLPPEPDGYIWSPVYSFDTAAEPPGPIS